jgi:hypothetical protein
MRILTDEEAPWFVERSRRVVSKADLVAATGVSPWDFGNNILYNLCKDYPQHKNHDEIIAKILLIGRSYAASIERRRNAELDSDNFYITTVAPTLEKSDLDAWLATLAEEVPGSPNAVAVHKKLMDLFESITKLNKRSLASKYLHFHLPSVFFIYDSRAKQAVTKVVPRLNKLDNVPAENFDQEYKDFVRRCVWLRQDIFSKHKVLLTPRQIDKLLLSISAESD